MKDLFEVVRVDRPDECFMIVRMEKPDLMKVCSGRVRVDRPDECFV